MRKHKIMPHPTAMATSSSYRSSLSWCSRKEGESPPKKIRKTFETSSIESEKRVVFTPSAPYYVTTPLGFSPNEFLPLDYAEKSKRKRPTRLDITKLSDDALGMCLFTGFLDSFEMARLRSVNQRIRRIASKQVRKLDLRKCEQLDASNISHIVSSYQNLTVRDVCHTLLF